MAYTAWDSLTLAELSDVTSKLRTARAITEESNSAAQDAIITDAMSNCKDDLKEQILQRVQNKYPQAISYYKGIYKRAQRELYNRINPYGLPNFGYISIFGTFVDVDSRLTGDDPQIFVSVGAPDNSTYSGIAYPGAFCWDQTPSGMRMYANYGTVDSNDWQPFDPQGMINYLSNPTVLKRAYIYGSIYYLFEGIASNNDAVMSFQLYAGQEERYYNKYCELTKRALSLLEVDTTNKGFISSSDIRSQKPHWGIR